MKAELIDYMGSDLTIVNAARVSFDKESDWELEVPDTEEEANLIPNGMIDWEHVQSDRWYGGYPTKYLSEKDVKLISYLAKHNHWTPFSHVQITMRETVPIFVARQRFKHVVGFTYNEVSRRYVDDAPEFYMPDVWREASENKKQGSSDGVVGEVKSTTFRTVGEDVYYAEFIEACTQFYNSMIKSGVAPEQARMVLPQSMYTSYYTTGSLAAWARAYKLRVDPHAQKEIQDLSVQWNDIITSIPELKHSWEALTRKED